MPERQAALLAVDVGTTHCKAGLFLQDGTVLKIGSRPTVAHRASDGSAYFDPDELWATVAAVIQEAAAGAQGRAVAALGVASMAETGMLVDRSTGAPRSALIPWYDPSASPQAEQLRRADDSRQHFYRTGMRATFKCSLAKLLWLREKDPQAARGAVWLSAADLVAYRLTGQMGTDYTLACRTDAFRLDQKTWDEDWLTDFHLEPEIFPPARPSGTPLGGVMLDIPGLTKGVPVAVTGHDHLSAAFAAGVVNPGQVFNSMGTAESFIGIIEEHLLGEAEFSSGFTYGCHTVPGKFYWMGGLSASGGSVEWLRSVLGEPPLSYAELEILLGQAPKGPTGILYFPYLAGSNSPHSDTRVRAAFVGLAATHGRAELLKAVLEGTAYELEYVRDAARQVTGMPIDHLRVTGGGTRNRAWTQIKADVTGCHLDLLSMPESTLLGAALLAGIGAGEFGSPAEVFASQNLPGVDNAQVETVLPDPARHQAYESLYRRGYLQMQAPLRALSQP